MVKTSRELLLVERGDFTGLDGLPLQVLFFLFRAVAPDHFIGMTEFGAFINPFGQFLVLGQVPSSCSGITTSDFKRFKYYYWKK
jgi:hypothetical protein